jgi:hypothetical protein
MAADGAMWFILNFARTERRRLEQALAHSKSHCCNDKVQPAPPVRYAVRDQVA